MNQQLPTDQGGQAAQPDPQGQNQGNAGQQPPTNQPAGGQPAAGQDPGAGQSPAVDESNRTGQLSVRSGHIFTIPPHPNTQFDEENFLTLLEGSISLTMEEKQRVIDAIPRLSIEQINELISIFQEEKQKFAELENEFADDVAKLKAEREKEIQLTEMKQEEAGAEEEDKAAAEALKKQMGL